MKKFTSLAGVFLAVLILCLYSSDPLQAQNVAKSTILPMSLDTLCYLEYRPSGYAAPGNTRKYPVIIFLHGGSERSDNTSLVKPPAGSNREGSVWKIELFGPARLAAQNKMGFSWNGKNDTFIVESPMSRATYRSSHAPMGIWKTEIIDKMINIVKADPKVDTNRIYLTGLSFGGGGTFRYISTNATNPTKLAAALSISGDPGSLNQPNFLPGGPQYVGDANLPVWGFHALNDTETEPDSTIAIINRINNRVPAPQVKALKTIWADGGHNNVWNREYNVDDARYKYGYEGFLNIYEWFLGQDKHLAPNALPTANPGSNFSVSKFIGTATLDGSSSSDVGTGIIVRYVWKKISAPAGTNVVIQNPVSNNATTTVSGLTVAGNYTFRLYVVDDRAGFDSTGAGTNDLVITAGTSNKPPVASAGTDKTITLPLDSVRVFGTSSDPDGTVAAILWEYVDGPATYTIAPNAIAQNPIMKNLQKGIYSFRFKVTDNSGAVTYDTMQINVLQPNNTPPTASAGADQTITLPVDSIMLYGTATDVSPGTISSYRWEMIDGPSAATIDPDANAQNPIMKDLVAGIYHFTITATDNDGAVGYDTMQLTVNPAPNSAPIAAAGEDVVLTLPEDSVRVYGTALDDKPNPTWVWSNLDGPSTPTIFPNQYALNPIFKNLTPGIFHFQIKVTDSDGLVQYDTVMIIVIGNIPPVADAGADKTITLPLDSIRIYGTPSDADGTVASILWEKISGPSGNVIYPNATAQNPIMKNLQQGVYYFRFKVTDDQGAFAYDTMKLTVNIGSPVVLEDAPEVQSGFAKMRISLYPNPGHDMLNITFDGSETGKMFVRIYDAKGALKESKVIQKQSKLYQQTINISGLSSGVYYAHVVVNGTRHIAQFIKK